MCDGQLGRPSSKAEYYDKDVEMTRAEKEERWMKESEEQIKYYNDESSKIKKKLKLFKDNPKVREFLMT